MRKPIIIIDNDALVNITQLADLDIFKLLRNIFQQILIPIEVKNEYEKQRMREPQRSFILNRLRPNEGFWALCTRYDLLSNVLLFTHKNIHKGEAEIISQAEKLNIRLVISDDVSFKNACIELNKNVQIYNSLFLLANLDMHGFVYDNIEFFTKLFKTRPFKHEDLISAYKIVGKQLGIRPNPEKISKNTYKQIIN